jgi:oligopeptide transport system substrate-binding protein
MHDKHRDRLTRRAALAATAVALTGVVALSRQARSSKIVRQAGDSNTLNRGNGAEPQTLDPNLIEGNWENNIVCDMFLGLMTEDAMARPIPGAAESYTVSDDGLVYTFKIRDHKWSDGMPVTAHDFVYSFRRVGNPKTAAQYAPILYPIQNMQRAAEGKVAPQKIGVRAIDDRTLELRFAFQVPYIEHLLMHETAMPIPAHVVKKYDGAWIDAAHIATNGPYTLKEWVSNDHIHLVKNPHFYARDTVAIENVFYYPTQDASAAIKRFRGGEFDLLTDTLPPQQVDWLQRTMPREVHLSPYLLSQYIQFNLTQKPFDDLRVRQALSMAIDREIITQKVMRGGVLPAYTYVPPDIGGGYPGQAHLRFKGMTMAERAERAKALLAEAGYGPRNPLTFDYGTTASTEAKLVSVALQEMWRQVGCHARIVPMESAILYDMMRKQDFSVGWTGWVADYRDAKDFLFLFQSSTVDLNYGAYRNATFDSLMAQSDYVRDPARRAALLDSAEQQLLDDVAIAPVFIGVTRNLVSQQVKGWKDNPTNFHRSRWLKLDRSAPMV